MTKHWQILHIKLNGNKFCMKLLYFIILVLSFEALRAQNELSKWYMSNGSALDFMTSPPTILQTNAIPPDSNPEGSTAMSDINGKLLFYSNGVTVFNKNHLPMANGTGLMGNISTSQCCVAQKKPGSNNLYYLFTLDDISNFSTRKLGYSIIDMSLAGGTGSVVVKNVSLSDSCIEKL